MTESLRAKLREIFNSHSGWEYSKESDKAIAQIEQAFADEGYVNKQEYADVIAKN